MRSGVMLAALLFILALSTSIISASSISLAKNSYYPGETIQADIYGFSGLNTNDILICKGNNVNPMGVQAGLAQISSESKYIYYAVIPSLPAGSYSIKIKSKPYSTQSCLANIQYSLNFNIISPSDKPYLSVNPGFIYDNKDFFIDLRIFNGNQKITITPELSATPSSNNFNMVEGQTKRINFDTSSVSGSVSSNIKINDYNIPVYLTKPVIHNQTAPATAAPEQNQTQTQQNQTQNYEEAIILSDEIKFSPESLSATILNNTDYTLSFLVANKGSKAIKNLTLSSSSSSMKLSQSLINLSAYQEMPINLTINLNEPLNASITLSYQNQSIYLPVNMTITNNKSEVSIVLLSDLIQISPGKIEETILKNKSYTFNITIRNTANYTLEDISISSSNPGIRLYSDNIESLRSNKTAVIKFDVIENESFESSIILSYKESFAAVPLSFDVTEPAKPVLIEDILAFYPEELNPKLISGRDYFYQIYLLNIGENALSSVNISSSNKNIKIGPESIEELPPYKKTIINLTITSDEDIMAYVYASYGNGSIKLPINITITKNESEVIINENEYRIESKTCSGYGWKTCSRQKNEKCDLLPEKTIADGSACCLGSCIAQTTSNAWAWGIGILAVLAIAGFFLYSRIKKGREQGESGIEKRTKNFEERMAPKEVKRSLGNV